MFMVKNKVFMNSLFYKVEKHFFIEQNVFDNAGYFPDNILVL